MYDRPDLMHALLGCWPPRSPPTSTPRSPGAPGGDGVRHLGRGAHPRDYPEFSLAYMRRIVAGLTREAEGRRVPVILFTKGGGQWLDRMAESGCDALGVDWTEDLADARRMVADRVALQGNLDPCILYASPARVRVEVERVLASYGHGHGPRLQPRSRHPSRRGARPRPLGPGFSPGHPKCAHPARTAARSGRRDPPRGRPGPRRIRRNASSPSAS
jgi:hypothetical protein